MLKRFQTVITVRLISQDVLLSLCIKYGLIEMNLCTERLGHALLEGGLEEREHHVPDDRLTGSR